MEYIIKYNIGQGNKIVNVESLDEAKEYAKEGIRFTEEDVSIYDAGGNLIITSRWFGTRPEKQDYDEGNVLEEIGGGFYTEWE